MRAYSQLGMMMENAATAGCPDGQQRAEAAALPPGPQKQQRLSQIYSNCPPQYGAGDLAQHRNFYNPEFDARLTDFTTWLPKGIRPDDFKFRFAWWGFYDGLYDYLNPEWDDHRRNLKARFSQSTNPMRESYAFNDENKNPRHIYASRNRINELYIDYTKGPVFIRAGRQAISWGESDTIALLDVQNPFDLTLGAPGFFQDVDEARIPLWTLRTTVKLLDSWKWLSSVFGDAYVVPGIIDTTVPINPIVGGVSPFGADQADPQLQLAGQTIPVTVNGVVRGVPLHISVVDRLPTNTWANTRWGFRLTGVVARDYTVQGWFFRTFNQQPAPLLVSPGSFDLYNRENNPLQPTLIDNRGFRTPKCNNIDPVTGFGTTPAGRRCSLGAAVINLLQRRLESVVGVAATWYSQPVNGIIRTEIEYFIDELAFIPDQNLNARSQLPAAFLPAGEKPPKTSIPTADYVRWIVGYDRNFFVRWLNPTNSFIAIFSFNSSFNLSEKGGRDYRNPVAKPGRAQAEIPANPKNPLCQTPATAQLCVRTNPHNFEDAYQYEGFLNTTIRTDYLHGRLTPQFTTITDVSGIFGFAPTVTYRINDNLLLGATYLAIASSRKAGLGTFRNHDMLQLRVTAQLN